MLGFLRSLITILLSKLKNSKWRAFLTKFDVFRSNCTKMNIRGFLRSLITILLSELKNSKCRIQYGGHFWLNSTFSVQIARKWIYRGFWGRWLRFCSQNGKIRNAGFNMVTLLTKFDVFRSNYTKMNMLGFSRSLITILQSELKNSKYRIQYGGHFSLFRRFSFELHKNEYTGVFEVADYDSAVRTKNLLLPLENEVYFFLKDGNKIFSIKLGQRLPKSFSQLHEKNSRFFLSYFLKKKNDWLKIYAGPRLPNLPYQIFVDV